MSTPSNPILTKARKTLRAYKANELTTDRDTLTCALIEDLASAYSSAGVRDKIAIVKELRMLLDRLPKLDDDSPATDAAEDFLASFADDGG